MEINKSDVAILMGSPNDLDKMKGAVEALKYFGLSCEVKVLSAHRAPEKVVEFVRLKEEDGTKVFICGAGGAAHLAGVVAGHTARPVVGVPISAGALKGMDALLATVQMPRGIPVATVAVDGSYNAGLLAAQIIATFDENVFKKFKNYKSELEEKVLAASEKIQSEL